MLHTMMLSYQLTRLGYEYNESKLIEYHKKSNEDGRRINIKLSDTDGIHICTYYIKPGLAIKTKRLTGEYVYYGLEFEVNPASLTKEFNLLNLTYEHEIPFFKLLINRCFQEIGLSISYDELIERRIDYAKNVSFENDTQLMQYFQLLKKFKLPKHFKIFEKYCKTAKHYKTYSNSIYLVNGSVHINIYNKGDHLAMLREKNIKYTPLSDMKTNVIRFEIQCNSRRLHYIKSKHHSGSSSSDSSLLTQDLSDFHLETYCKQMFLTGDFYSIAEAERIIHSSNLKNDTKDAMCDFISKVAKSSIRNIKETLNESIATNKQLHDFLKRFDKLGVNPITIPKVWGYKRIPNPLKYLSYQNQDTYWEK